MMDDVRGLDTYILADSQLNYQFDVRLPYREPSGLFDGAAESVWDVRTWHNIATGTVATRDYNYRRASTPMNTAVSVRNDAVTTGEHYRYAAPYLEAGDDASPEPETEPGAFYARLHHERELNRSARIHLFNNAAHLTPGQVLEPQGYVIMALQEGVILTLVTFRGARDSRLHVSVWGLPYTERYCFRPVEIPRPIIPGNGEFYYQGKPYDQILNAPIAVSAETHGDFWEDDIDYSETVSYEGVDAKARAQAKTDEKTCENCPPEGKVMPMVRRCSRWSEVTISYQTRICGTFYNPETKQIQEVKYCGVSFDGWKDKLCQFWEAKARYDQFLISSQQKKYWWKGDRSAVNQAARHQAVTTINQPLKVIWIFMQPISFSYFQRMFIGFQDIIVRYQP